MPSKPSANSPFMQSRLEAALGVRSPGTPSSSGKPGVQAADLSYPAPPAVATGVPGRPPVRPPQPAAPLPQWGGLPGGQIPPWMLPGGSQARPGAPVAQPPVPVGDDPRHQPPTPVPPAGSPPKPPPAQQPQPAQTPTGGDRRPGLPKPRQQAGAFGGPGATDGAVSPFGATTVNPDGTSSTALSPEGDMRYRAAVLAGREALGPLPRIFRNPGLPQMPYELGRWNFNPFTGTFRKG